MKNKQKTRNNIISKLAGSTWESNATVLRVSALALVHSVAEYCAPVWFRSSHCKKVFWSSTKRSELLMGTIRLIQVLWLPVLANIAPPELRRMMHAERSMDKIKRNPNLLLNEVMITHPQKMLKSRRPIWDLTFPVEA